MPNNTKRREVWREYYNMALLHLDGLTEQATC